MGHFRRLLEWNEKNKSAKRGGRRSPHRRALRVEPLECRRLLTTVNTLVDEVDGSIIDGDVSLRDAIALTAAGSTIDFDPALTAGGPATINLTPSAVTIAKALTITGPGANLLTIVAHDLTPTSNNGDGHRVFVIDDSIPGVVPVTIQGLTLTGADANGFGGAISSAEALTVRNMVIRENSAVNGAGIASTGPLSVFDSEIINNVTTGAGAGILINTVSVASPIQVVGTTVRNNDVIGSGRGGGIFAIVPVSNPLRVTDSLIIDNDATLDGGGISCNTGGLIVTNSAIIHNHSNANGGGIKTTGALTINDSQIENNSAAAGGGIHADAATTLSATTIANNTATGNGGGVVVQNTMSTWSQLTISGNRANGSGGGVYATQPLTIYHSTIVKNRADFDDAGGGTGGGVHYTQATGNPIGLDHTILAQNLHGTATGDDGVGPLAAVYCWIGIADSAGLTIFDTIGNEMGTTALPKDPLLDSLASNDGPTLRGGYSLLTHSPQIGSPVVDRGDTDRIPGTPPTPILDQRGTGYSRVYNTTGTTLDTIDIGAIEQQPSRLVGDYNFDRVVNAADYTIWRNTVGSAIDKRADGNRDGTIDMADHTAWKTHYGEVLATSGAGSGAALTETVTAPAPEEPSTASDESGAVVEGSSASSMSSAAGLLAAPTSDSQRASAARQLAAATGPAGPASNDAALLAWLAMSTHVAGPGDEQSTDDDGSDLPAGDSDGGELDSMDAVFAGLGGDAL
ncbi:MAG: choice-of-anchor Q domain-containing protein [Pirellulales bacterium]